MFAGLRPARQRLAVSSRGATPRTPRGALRAHPLAHPGAPRRTSGGPPALADFPGLPARGRPLGGQDRL